MRLFILLLITTFGCQSITNGCRGVSNKEICADHVLHKIAKQIKKETGLLPSGTNGQMLHEIQKLGLSFECYRSLDIIEGRKLLVQCVNDLMNEINEYPPIHQYLIRNPFLPRHIRIKIFIYEPGKRDVPPGSLCVISADDGKLCYKIDSLDTYGFTTIYEETYEEALERIADPTLPLVAYHPDQKRIRPEELARLRQGIRFIGNDGAIWRLDENGNWVKK